MKDLITQIKGYKEQNWKIEGEEPNKYVITPRGFVYSTNFLGFNQCPICSLYLEDNPEEKEIWCDHDEEDIQEIQKAEDFLKLVNELEGIELCKALGI